MSYSYPQLTGGLFEAIPDQSLREGVIDAVSSATSNDVIVPPAIDRPPTEPGSSKMVSNGRAESSGDTIQMSGLGLIRLLRGKPITMYWDSLELTLHPPDEGGDSGSDLL